MSIGLNAAYWGSMLAIFIGVILMAVDPFFNGVPSHFGQLDGDYIWATYYLTLLFVGFISIRYYFAISFNLYGGSPAALAFMPVKSRNLSFWLVVTLVVGSVFAGRLFATMSLPASLVVCGVMSLASLALWIIVICYAEMKPEKFQILPMNFGLADVATIVFCFWLFQLVSKEIGENQITTMAIGVILFLILSSHQIAQSIKHIMDAMKEVRTALAEGSDQSL